RHDVLAEVLVSHQAFEQVDKDHGGGDGSAAAAFEERLDLGVRRAGERGTIDAALRHITAERLAALLEIADLLAVLARLVIIGGHHLLVAEDEVKAGAEAGAVLLGYLLGLVSGVHAFAGNAQAIALDRLGEDDRRLSLVLHGRLVRSVDLLGIVAAAPEAFEI